MTVTGSARTDKKQNFGGDQMEILRAEHVSYSYQTKYQKVEAVRDVSCVFEQGGFYAIVGESGSG